jgi:hypothetical protein
MIPAQILTLNLCWNEEYQVVWGFSSAHLCRILMLFTHLVNVASSVHSTQHRTSHSFIILCWSYQQNWRQRLLSPGCSPCAGFTTELHKPCTSHSVRGCVQLSLHACIWCNGTARHVRETDDLPATVWWGVQVRQSILHIAQCIARVQESCAALLYKKRIQLLMQCMPNGILGMWWIKWHWCRFSPSTPVSPANSHSTDYSTFINYPIINTI